MDVKEHRIPPLVPTIHLNGTPADRLSDAVDAALAALRTAIKAVAETAPNARDYYVQGPDAAHRAGREHEARMHRLADNVAELMAIRDGIQSQVDERAHRRAHR